MKVALMGEAVMRSSKGINVVQLVAGLLFLLIGVSVYFWVRGVALSSIPDVMVVHRLFSYSVIQLTNQLPTFTRLVAFSLLTAGLLAAFTACMIIRTTQSKHVFFKARISRNVMVKNKKRSAT